MPLNFPAQTQPINLAQIYGQADQDKFNQMKMQQATQSMADEQAVKNAYTFNPDGSLDEKTTLSKLYPVAPDKAYAFQQGIDTRNASASKLKREEQTARLGDAEKLITIQGKLAGRVLSNPTLENAIYATKQFGQMTGQDVSQELDNLTKNIGNNPDAIMKWAGSHALDAEKLLGKIQSVNNGQFNINQMVDPLIGKVTETGRTQMLQTPDSVASIANTKEQGALNRGVTIRGQNISRENANDRLEFDKGGGKASEKITADMRTSGQYAKRMVAAEKLLDQTTDQKPGVMESIAGLAGETAANMNRSPDRQDSLQAQRDWVRAKLRKESGASIGDAEMQNEIYTYFPQIGDSDSVIAQKKQARNEAVNGLIEASGGGYSEPANIPTGAPIIPKNEKMPSKLATPIKSDNDYNKLPSGTRFKAPDGTIRIKP
jgi:hypothetical protein